MDIKTINELKDDCDTGSLYDFVANNYWKLSVEDLRDILEETIDVVTNGMTDEEKADLTRKICQSLKDNTNALEAE